MKSATWVAVLAVVCLMVLHRVHGSDDPPASLTGLWGSERTLGPEVRGELTVIQQGSHGHAEIAGFEAPVRLGRGTLRFALPGDRGEFRGRVTRDATAILGHWIQPGRMGDGVRYATPVELKAVRGDTWRGQVVPLDDRLSLYLVIRPRSDGSVGAFLRDPERNLGMDLPIEHVVCQGEVVRFVGRQEGEDLLVGRYDRQSDRLSVFFPFYRATLDFTRRGRDEAAGFYPRTPAAATDSYRPPLAEDDGWATASLTDVGLDPGPIRKLVHRILLTETKDVTTPCIQGLLIARHGKLVLEEYFYGFHKERPHDTRSAGKSLASTLIGIAIDRGAPFDVTTPVYALFPKYARFAHDEARKRKMTVEHLLTMTAGFDCDDNTDSSPGNEDRMQTQTEQPDWYKYTLDLPMAHDPGEEAVYCTAGINLLGGIIENTTGEWLPDFLYAQFARPLDIRHYHVNLTPLGTAYMGGGIQMRPRDFLKLGQLFLAGGRWNGRRVISQRWVERATRPHAHFGPDTEYGYAWWIKAFRAGGRTYRAFNAEGNGGQLVIVLPDLDLVVMFTGGNYGNFPTWSKFRDELVPEFIIPAAVSR
jgi:CubicO group peptidase (beta-lactamase class C family)